MIEATDIDTADGVEIHPSAVIRAERVRLGPGAVIGPEVDVSCDELVLGEGARIGGGARLTSPVVDLGPEVNVGAGVSAELNERLAIGAVGQVGPGVVIKGQSAEFGEGLWLKSGTVIGGGGWASADSRVIAGDRVAIFDDCFLNVSDRITIGDDSGLSSKVAIITHGAYHNPLDGYPTQFAPVVVGNRVAVYYDSKVLPGVTIGDGSIIGTGSVVIRDVPAQSFAIGAPARVVSKGNYPPTPDELEKDEIIRSALCAWLDLIPFKGARVVEDRLADEDRAEIEWRGRARTLAYYPLSADRELLEDCDVTVSARPADSVATGRAHFDLDRREFSGESDPLIEDLRDQLRRRGLRVPSPRPYASLPLANLARLQQRRSAD